MAAHFVGAQIEFCLTVVKVCKEIIPFCDKSGIQDTYCCVGRLFFLSVVRGKARTKRDIIEAMEMKVAANPELVKFTTEYFHNN